MVRFDADDLEILDAVPDPCMVTTPDLVIRLANRSFLAATFTTPSDLLDVHLFDAFPIPDGDREMLAARRRLRASFDRVVTTGGVEVGPVNRYDLPGTADTAPICRYWSPVASAIRDDDGPVRLLLHRVQDVTAAHVLLAAARGGSTGRSGVGGSDGGAVAAGSHSAAPEEAEVTEQLDRLSSVWHTRMVIEQAKGILMANHRIGAEEAFELLRKESQRGNTKLRMLAAAYVAGTAPVGVDPTAQPGGDGVVREP